MNELMEYISENTTIDDKTLQENIGTEWFIPAKLSIEYGIAHEIVADIDQLL